MKKITAVLAAAVLLAALCACSLPAPAAYPAEAYELGDAVITDKVESLRIEWPSDELTVVTHPENTIEITETVSGDLPENQRVHWRLEGTTLHIRRGEPKLMDFSIGGARQSLTVTLPEDLTLSDFNVGVASADVLVRGVTADRAELSASSGNIRGGLAADRLDVSVSSGDVDIVAAGRCESVSLSSSSGRLGAVLGKTGAIRASASSGNVSITAECVDALDVDTSSGTVTLSLASAPEKGRVATSSGHVTLSLPETADLTLDIDTASGDVDWSVPLKRNGDEYILGSGEDRLEIETSSGDITILKA